MFCYVTISGYSVPDMKTALQEGFDYLLLFSYTPKIYSLETSYAPCLLLDSHTPVAMSLFLSCLLSTYIEIILTGNLPPSGQI